MRPLSTGTHSKPALRGQRLETFSCSRPYESQKWVPSIHHIFYCNVWFQNTNFTVIQCVRVTWFHFRDDCTESFKTRLRSFEPKTPSHLPHFFRWDWNKKGNVFIPQTSGLCYVFLNHRDDLETFRNLATHLEKWKNSRTLSWLFLYFLYTAPMLVFWGFVHFCLGRWLDPWRETCSVECVGVWVHMCSLCIYGRITRHRRVKGFWRQDTQTETDFQHGFIQRGLFVSAVVRLFVSLCVI